MKILVHHQRMNKNKLAFIHHPYWQGLKQWDRILALCCCLLTFPVVIFTFYNIHNGIWFNSFQYLTIQGNLIFWTFLLLYAFLHNRRIFNKDYFLICADSYILFVFLGFNCLLLRSDVLHAEFMSAADWTGTVWYHMFSPIVDFVFTGFILGRTAHGIPKFQVTGWGMIYIAYQMVYFTVLPFISAAVRYWNKVQASNYLNVPVSNHVVGGVSNLITFNGHGNNLISVSNQMLNNFSGSQRTEFANAMISKWFTVDHEAFVSLKNGQLVLAHMPDTAQLAQIYHNMGIGYGAIRTINANTLVYFPQNVYSVYGSLTNLNKNVHMYSISTLNHATILHIFDAINSSNFDPDTSKYNLYTSTPGSGAQFGIYVGCIIAYYIFFCCWWAIAQACEKAHLKHHQAH